jgi:hypothetical protein
MRSRAVAVSGASSARPKAATRQPAKGPSAAVSRSARLAKRSAGQRLRGQPVPGAMPRTGAQGRRALELQKAGEMHRLMGKAGRAAQHQPAADYQCLPDQRAAQIHKAVPVAADHLFPQIPPMGGPGALGEGDHPLQPGQAGEEWRRRRAADYGEAGARQVIHHPAQNAGGEHRVAGAVAHDEENPHDQPL